MSKVLFYLYSVNLIDLYFYQNKRQKYQIKDKIICHSWILSPTWILLATIISSATWMFSAMSISSATFIMPSMLILWAMGMLSTTSMFSRICMLSATWILSTNRKIGGISAFKSSPARRFIWSGKAMSKNFIWAYFERKGQWKNWKKIIQKSKF